MSFGQGLALMCAHCIFVELCNSGPRLVRVVLLVWVGETCLSDQSKNQPTFFLFSSGLVLGLWHLCRSKSVLAFFQWSSAVPPLQRGGELNCLNNPLARGKAVQGGRDDGDKQKGCEFPQLKDNGWPSQI